MTQYKCRRKKMVEAQDFRTVIKNLIVLDPSKNYKLFDECVDCGYGRKKQILKSRKPPFEYHEIKVCTLSCDLDEDFIKAMPEFSREILPGGEVVHNDIGCCGCRFEGSVKAAI